LNEGVGRFHLAAEDQAANQMHPAFRLQRAAPCQETDCHLKRPAAPADITRAEGKLHCKLPSPKQLHEIVRDALPPLERTNKHKSRIGVANADG
jgi:hypothetical protein